VSDQGCVLKGVRVEEGGDIGGESGIGVCIVVGGFAVVTEIEGIDGAGEGTSKGAVRELVSSEKLLKSEGTAVLAHTPIVLFATEETVQDHDWVAFRFALIIVEAVGKIENFAARRCMKGACPWRRRGREWQWYPCGMFGMEKRRTYGPQAAMD